MYDNEAIMAAIWADPGRCTDLELTYKGGAWQSSQDPDGTAHHKSGGRTIIRRNPSTGVIYVNYNGDGFTQSQGIIKFLKWKWSTNDTYEVYKRLGELYGIEPDTSQYTEAQRTRYEKRKARQPLLDAVAKYVTWALEKSSKAKTARDYLQGRGLEPSVRLGAINESIAADLKAALAKKYPDTIGADGKALDDLFTLGADEATGKPGYRINLDDYQLIGPYYNGTHVAGFWLRLTTDATTWTDKDGREHKKAKYLFNNGLAKGGYCGSLNPAAPVILVEGLLDAERLKQAQEQEEQEAAATGETLDPYRLDLSNVLALGGVAPTDADDDPARSQIQTLERYGVKKVIYVPDHEYYTQEDEEKGRGAAGTLKTKATQDTIKAILPHLTTDLDGPGFVSLQIAELYGDGPDDKTKQDADTFIAGFGPSAFRLVLEDAAKYWQWQLKQAAASLDGIDLQAAAERIYNHIHSEQDKELLKAELARTNTGYLAKLKAVGFNADALGRIDRHGVATSYREDIIEDLAALDKAVKDNATAGTIGEVIKRLAKTQADKGTGKANGFYSQANATPEQIEEQIATQADYIETPWKLYRCVEDSRDKTIKDCPEVRNVSFAPAAISIVAASTNHGKTAVLMQTAIYLASQGDKRYIYISTEEDQRQLYLRACASYIGTDWPEDSHPRKDLRQAIRKDMPADLFSSTTAGPSKITQKKAEFNRLILPNLRLIYGNEDITTLCSHIVALVEDWRNQGIEAGGIFLDYLQMIRADRHSYGRTDELQAICAELNDLAKTTGLPLIVGAQLNRQATQKGQQGVGFDGIELANIGDSTGIERIANDVYLVWYTDKMKAADVQDANGEARAYGKLGYRTRRVVDQGTGEIVPHTLYIENLKARDYETGAYCLVPFNGATGVIGRRTEYKAR